MLALHVFDALLGIPQMDILNEGKQVAEKNAVERSQKKAEEHQNRKTGTHPSHELSEYEGAYFHPGYGEVQIKAVGDSLEMKFNRIDYRLEHWHYDVFSIESASEDLILPVEGIKISFQSKERGTIEEMHIPFEPKVPDIVFKRKPEEKSELASYLSRFVGVYEVYGYTVDIALKGESLFAVIPGQPTYELIPNGENAFGVKKETGLSIRFKMGLNQQVEEAVLMLPYGVAFTAKPKRISKSVSAN